MAWTRLNYNLFLDDERNVADVKWIEYPLVHWVVVRNYKEFVDTVSTLGVPKIVSFDHDLADKHYLEYFKACEEKREFDYNASPEKTGYHACKWLIEHCLEKNIPLPKCYIHTQNSIGKNNIQSLIDSYKKVSKIEP